MTEKPSYKFNLDSDPEFVEIIMREDWLDFDIGELDEMLVIAKSKKSINGDKWATLIRDKLSAKEWAKLQKERGDYCVFNSDPEDDDTGVNLEYLGLYTEAELEDLVRRIEIQVETLQRIISLSENKTVTEIHGSQAKIGIFALSKWKILTQAVLDHKRGKVS